MKPRESPREPRGTGSDHATQAERSIVADRWRDADAGRRYRDRRWRTPRAGRRDLHLVRRILARHGIEPSRGGILDAPCGTGRLRPVLERDEHGYVGVDVSLAMLRGSDESATRRVLCASADRLPFDDGTFDVVVSCRLLHHVPDANDLAQYVNELTRVSARLVVASFWDAASLHAWRRRVGLRRASRPEGRCAVPKVVLQRLFEEAGAPIVDFEHSFRFVSQQAFLVARKGAPVQTPALRAARVRKLETQPVLGAEGALGQA